VSLPFISLYTDVCWNNHFRWGWQFSQTEAKTKESQTQGIHRRSIIIPPPWRKAILLSCDQHALAEASIETSYRLAAAIVSIIYPLKGWGPTIPLQCGSICAFLGAHLHFYTVLYVCMQFCNYNVLPRGHHRKIPRHRGYPNTNSGSSLINLRVRKVCGSQSGCW